VRSPQNWTDLNQPQSFLFVGPRRDGAPMTDLLGKLHASPAAKVRKQILEDLAKIREKELNEVIKTANQLLSLDRSGGRPDYVKQSVGESSTISKKLD
jgi:hypothetical protein